jgi:hypothetical protein
MSPLSHGPQNSNMSPFSLKVVISCEFSLLLVIYWFSHPHLVTKVGAIFVVMSLDVTVLSLGRVGQHGIVAGHERAKNTIECAS